MLVSVRKLGLELSRWLDKRRVKAFYCPVAHPSLRSGVQSLLQLAGMGKLRPNILLLGFKNDWRYCASEHLEEYVGIIQSVRATDRL